MSVEVDSPRCIAWDEVPILISMIWTCSIAVAAHVERSDGPVALRPGQAALLHAISVTEVRDRCCAWRDDAAWWLWTDLIRAAPPWPTTPAPRLALLVHGMVAAQIHPQIVRDAFEAAVQEATAECERRRVPPGRRGDSCHDHPSSATSDKATNE